MADDKLIRIKRLKEALDDALVPKRDRASYLVSKCGSSLSYWSGLLAGDRSFGERVSRRIEEGLGLYRGYLDEAEMRFSGTALEIAAIFDGLTPHDQAVLAATAHALVRPAPVAGPAAPEPIAKPASRRRKHDA